MSADGARDHDDLVVAYREGLGLAVIAVVEDADGIRIVPSPDNDKGALTRWWCRRASDAETVAAAAEARLRRRATVNVDLARESVERAAKRLAIALHSDGEIRLEAATVIDRIDCEFQRLRGAGGFRTINKSYRTYRLEASARRARVVPYARWLTDYKQNLVRKAAAALRYL